MSVNDQLHEWAMRTRRGELPWRVTISFEDGCAIAQDEDEAYVLRHHREAITLAIVERHLGATYVDSRLTPNAAPALLQLWDEVVSTSVA